ncbi:multidrug resistance efflux pump [Pararhizobium capsulatum DSM 1112]|uniref:Multidrug resistance efflux pump n=1 Tax=Pararhizobium capsulatum DSM 1112 TaxID=1121113 RepID=A0ABU0BNB6_9HYPH|nr:HlyD family secretion protein [Pararhizobium capsulatum]MDQ0319756.1 multidrug resistance efflux pump [Pararhizobium capsulatum DSM 1112]
MLKALRSPATLITLIAGIAGVFLALYAWRLPPFATSVETTDNAYVRGMVTTMSPQVSGYVVEVPVKDYQAVKQGDLLVRVDDRTYVQKLAQTQASLEAQKATLASSHQQELSAKANITAAEAQVAGSRAAEKRSELAWNRIQGLNARNIAPTSDVEEARATLDQAKATVAQHEAALDVARQSLQTILVNRASLEAAVSGAEATVELAKIDLGNTRIVAPRDGHVGEVGARLGQYVTAGTQLLAVVPKDLWIVANFKETQLDGMQIGQPVTFTVDALKGREVRGHIERFSPAAGSEFSIIKADNATGNFTKIAQRVGVRVSIDPGQELSERLSPGLSVIVRIDKSAEPSR